MNDAYQPINLDVKLPTQICLQLWRKKLELNHWLIHLRCYAWRICQSIEINCRKASERDSNTFISDSSVRWLFWWNFKQNKGWFIALLADSFIVVLLQLFRVRKPSYKKCAWCVSYANSVYKFKLIGVHEIINFLMNVLVSSQNLVILTVVG